MTAPRPEAVELAERLLALTGLDASDVPAEASRWSDLIDAALTAARADERERAAKVCESLKFHSDKSFHSEDDCAAAIRAMEGR